jgi:adenosylmethionine-8-amino-7-oxononanoate aminotransferase
MLLVPDQLYEPLRQRDSSDGPLLIVDEIATGFGRTGSMFAFPGLDLKPDLVCLGKGITGGTLALSATMAGAHVYDAFIGEFADGRHLLHGHSYAGNPIACAAALASLEVFEREGTLAHVATLDRELEALLEPLARHARVREVRRAGLMCAIELRAEAIPIQGSRSAAWRVADMLYEAGHFTRPLSDAIQLVPPLSATRAELAAFADALTTVLDAA